MATVASLLTGLPPPMPADGELATAWRKWLQKFEIYLKATRQAGEDTPDDVKTSLLLLAIGSEGQEPYETFSFASEEEREVYAVVLKKFEDFYIPKTNITCERYRFFTRTQELGETVDHYVTALRKLAQTCDFRDIKDSLIRDRIVLGVADQRITKRLLAAGDPDLTKALEICRAEEVAAAQRQRMVADAQRRVNVATVHHDEDDDDDDDEQGSVQVDALRQRSSSAVRGAMIKDCRRCGETHPARKCPAWGKRCLKCSGFNHLKSMCRTKRVNVVRTGSGWDQGSHEWGTPKEISTPSSTQVGPVYNLGMIGAVQESGRVWRIPLLTNGTMVSHKVDTGAEVSLLLRVVYNRLHQKAELHPSAAKLLPYGAATALPVDGQCVCQVTQENGRARYLRFLVVPSQEEPLLGLGACEHLGLVNTVAAVREESDSSEPLLEGANVDDSVKIQSDPVARQFGDVFEGLGCLQSCPYTIRLKDDARPHAIATPRRVPLPFHEKVKKELERMDSLGVIEEATGPSDWVSPMVVVPKKNGSVRICVDYTKLNQSVKRERYLLPTADELFANVRGARYFSTLDASSGFWQVPLTKDSSHLTTFLTPHGRFQFTRLPFGLNSGPEVFHRPMCNVLEGIEGAECYIDDVLIWAETQELHDARLRQVLERCRQSGIRLNASKCRFRLPQVKYFGYCLSAAGIHPDRSRVQAMLSTEAPKTREELRRFIGMVAYLAKFLPCHSQVTGPLRELLKDGTDWFWGPAQQKAFEDLKRMLSQAPVLAFYDPDAVTIVSADASSYGMGAVLLQVQPDGQRAAIAYASRAMTGGTLKLTWGCEHFGQYLLGRTEPFTVETITNR